MTETSLLRIASPLVVSFTFRFLFTLVDMGFAAVLDEDNASVAAIGFYAPLAAVMIAVWVGLSAGFTAALSAAFGAHDERRVRALKRGVLRILAAAVPALMALGGAIWVLVPYLGLEPALAQAFRVYGTTVMVGMAFTGFWSIYPDSIVKAHHATRDTMMAGIASTLTNVALNSWFVFGLSLGLFGIALATVLSRLVGLAYAAWRANLHETRRLAGSWDRGTHSWHHPPVRAILGLAVPGALTHLLAAGEGAAINAVLAVAPDSTTAIASWGVYERLLSLSIMPAIATSVAVIPYVAKAWPQGQAARIARELRTTLLWMLGISLVTTVVMGYAFAQPLAAFFIDSTDGTENASAHPTTLGALRLLPIGSLALVPFVILRPVFEGVQRPRTGVRLTVLRYVAFSLPLVVAGGLGAPLLDMPPLHGLVLGLAAASALASWVTLRAVRGVLGNA